MRRRVKTHAVFKSASDLSPGAKGRGISVGSAKRITEPDPACHQESRYHGHALAELFARFLCVKVSGVGLIRREFERMKAALQSFSKAIYRDAPQMFMTIYFEYDNKFISVN